MSLLSSITSFFHGEKRICSSEFEHAVNEVFLSDIPARLRRDLHCAERQGSPSTAAILSLSNSCKLTNPNRSHITYAIMSLFVDYPCARCPVTGSCLLSSLLMSLPL